MGSEVQGLPWHQQVLMVAEPGDGQANSLVEELRLLGIDILLVETVDLATRADEYGACIVVLRPGTWRATPTIVSAMRSNPRYLIPVLAEPMPLPRGAWTTEAISLEEATNETAQKLASIINIQLQKVPAQENERAWRASRREPGPEVMTVFRAIARKWRIKPIYRYMFVGLLVVLLIGFLAYYIPHIKASMPATAPDSALSGLGVSASVFDQDYSAAVPGPDCNAASNDLWSVGTSFVSYGTPTITSIQTPAATPTGQVINDDSTQTNCQQNGLLVKDTQHYDAFANVIFSGNVQDALPQHFSTQVTVSAIGTSDEAEFLLGVRNQSNANASSDQYSGYGDIALLVGVDGSWDTVRFKDSDGNVDKYFTEGSVKAAQTYTLGGEVEGARITFFINGQKITTIVDTTYQAGYGIQFALSDPGATSPPSALYTHFSYKHLADTSLSTRSAVATATAQATPDLQTP
jgi:hypothetical protein